LFKITGTEFRCAHHTLKTAYALRKSKTWPLYELWSLTPVALKFM